MWLFMGEWNQEKDNNSCYLGEMWDPGDDIWCDLESRWIYMELLDVQMVSFDVQ